MTFQINTPILLAGQYFVVRYRLLPGGPWVYLSAQDNDPFDIDGLSPGNYELGVSLAYGSPATICPESYYYFTIPGGTFCNCMGITSASIIEENGLTKVHLEYQFQYVQPLCGWTITIVSQDTGVSFTVTYPTLPDDEVDILISNPDSECYQIIINANCCDETGIECYNEIRCLAEPEECTHIEIVQAKIIKIGTQYYIQIVITQSTPITDIFDIYYFQFNNFLSGVADTGTIAYSSSGATTLTFPIYPNFNIQAGTRITYNGSLVDGCRFLTKFEAVYIPA